MRIATKQAYIVDQTAFTRVTDPAIKRVEKVASLSKTDAVRLAVMKIRAGVIAVS
jgi:hypothetical protein